MTDPYSGHAHKVTVIYETNDVQYSKSVRFTEDAEEVEKLLEDAVETVRFHIRAYKEKTQ
jgi:hypothetical protein